jgi:hypothetical protein
MSWRERIFAAVVLAGLLASGGCSLEEGIRDGVSDGAAGALSAIIQTPINFMLDQAFAEDKE